MIRTAIVHNRHDLTLLALRDVIAKTLTAETKIAPFQLPELGPAREWQSSRGPIVSAVHIATDNPMCFRLPEAGEIKEFRDSCQSLEKYAPDEWATLVDASGCVFVESGRRVDVHSRSDEITVYRIPVLQLTTPDVQQTIWRVAEALDALVLGEEGQLIWRPGESGWSEPSLKGGRRPISTTSE